MPIHIRPAAREDLRETVLIYLECLRGDYACKPQAHLDAKNVDEELAECKEWLYDSGSPNQIFVAMDGGAMAGYIAVGPNIGRPFNRGGEVCGFFVRKQYRRQGVGLRLMQAGIRYLQGLGYQQVVIFCYHVAEANGLYRRLGGEVVYQEIQSPGGMPFETDVFCYQIPALLETLEKKLT